MSAALGLAPAARRGEAETPLKKKRGGISWYHLAEEDKKPRRSFISQSVNRTGLAFPDRDRETWREVEAPAAAAAAAGKHGG